MSVRRCIYGNSYHGDGTCAEASTSCNTLVAMDRGLVSGTRWQCDADLATVTLVTACDARSLRPLSDLTRVICIKLHLLDLFLAKHGLPNISSIYSFHFDQLFHNSCGASCITYSLSKIKYRTLVLNVIVFFPCQRSFVDCEGALCPGLGYIRLNP